MQTLLLATLLVFAPAATLAQPASKIVKIEHIGELLREPNLPGERRADDSVPGQTTGLRLSRDRWLILCNTRGFRGVDDERSIVYQLRQDAPDGRVLTEGFLSKSINDWDPLGDGQRSVRQHGHVVGFGVPRGALIAGKPAAPANLFVALWRVVAVPYDAEKKMVPRTPADLREKTQGVEWVQFRLNDNETDIEIVRPVTRLRQVGHDKDAFCSLDVKWMNQTFATPVTACTACTDWLLCNHFDGGRIAALKLSFQPDKKVYEWVRCGPLSAGALALSEASLAKSGNDWIVAARVSGQAQGVAWCRTKDPLMSLPELKLHEPPVTNAPLTMFTCADGALRIFTGDHQASPQKRGRDPLFLWQVNPATFECTGRSVLFDTVAAKLPFRHAAWPKVDFGRLFPPHGKTQLVAYRVNVRSNNFGYPGRTDIPPITAAEKAHCGIYYSRITYEDVVPEPWTFAPPR